MLLINFLLVLLGLVFGSFISALSYRYPKRISVVKGRSFCPNCKHRIAWHDNIPLLSFLFLGGKCRNCKKPISWRYPIIELVTGIGFLFIGLNILYLVIFCILELIFIIDLEHQIIPDFFVFLGILVVLLVPTRALTGQAPLIAYSLFSSVFAGFLVASFLMFIHLITRGRGMGLGDVKFAVLGGLLVGLNLSLIWLFLAFLTGGIAGIILILGKKAGLKDKIAFGPFLIIGIGLTYLFGDSLLSLLFR